MYTVSKGPSKLVAKTTRRGISQNYDSVRDISRRNGADHGEDFEQISVPKPVFQSKKSAQYLRSQSYHQPPEEVLSPQHEELIKYIHESWNIVAASNPYDAPPSPDSTNGSLSSNSSNSSYSNASTSTYYVGTPSPLLRDFKPFDLESWWGRRLFNNITKSL